MFGQACREGQLYKAILAHPIAQIDQVTKLVLFDYENFLKRLATAAFM